MPPGDPSLELATWGLAPDALARVPALMLGTAVPGATLGEVLAELQRIYCARSAFEVEHLSRHEERAWLNQAIESGAYDGRPDPGAQRQILERLTAVEALEQFLQRAYLGQKRFSIEGLDVVVPMIDAVVELAAAAGARSVELGMAHRGRLNVMAHVVGVPYAEILVDFERSRPAAEAEESFDGLTSDVKYHRGASGVYDSASGPVQITLSANPSHLEAIGPIVEGRARAEQTVRTGPAPTRDTRTGLPLLIHGDAAFAGQGVVAETFNLARLDGYTTGGTVHLIANNQLGFTVEPAMGRSTVYASDVAKAFDVPVVHVNADDPDACLAAVRLAVAYRGLFHADFVIDVIGYRRHGHNEEDEPAYTQPRMYEAIAAHPTVREVYARQLVAAGVIDEASAKAGPGAAMAQLMHVQEALAGQPA
ncbi:MAG: thiamine pyrophosphate-dependent enzyme, partial [Gaiellales bacterium]